MHIQAPLVPSLQGCVKLITSPGTGDDLHIYDETFQVFKGSGNMHQE